MEIVRKSEEMSDLNASFDTSKLSHAFSEHHTEFSFLQHQEYLSSHGEMLYRRKILKKKCGTKIRRTNEYINQNHLFCYQFPLLIYTVIDRNGERR